MKNTNRIQLTKNLWLDEFIPPDLYWEWMNKNKPHVLIGLLDFRMIESVQKLRDKFGPVTINNWWHGLDREWSGIRTPGSKYFSNTSQHPHGRAADQIYQNATAEEVRRYIRIHYRSLGITFIETGVDWVHHDTRWTWSDKLVEWNPNE